MSGYEKIRGRCSLAITYCQDCEKLSYSSRRRARKIANQLPEHRNVYRCPSNELLWHIGMLPDVVRHGHLTKDEFFQRAG